MAAALGATFPETGVVEVFNSCGNSVLGGGKNVRGSIKPDVVVTRGSVSLADSQQPAIFHKVHMLGECKTVSGTPFHAQCAKYVERFSRPGTAFDFVIGLKECRIRVLLFTPKQCSEVASFDYGDGSDEAVKWMHLLLSDGACDRAFESALKRDVAVRRYVSVGYGTDFLRATRGTVRIVAAM